MIVTSPAKLNLALNVGDLRPDGFHEVDSVFHLLDFHDDLIVSPAESFHFSCSKSLGIPAEENLVVKAVRLMSEYYGRTPPDVSMHLIKRIPHGGGLGGGSSNAAAAITALSTLNGLTPDKPAHLELAAQLGSDVALFLAPTSASVMTGRGEILAESLQPVPGLPIVLVQYPGTLSPTSQVYQAWDTSPQPPRDQARLIATLKRAATDFLSTGQPGHNTIVSIAHDLYNSLGEVAAAVTPECADLVAWLQNDARTVAASVAGSGSVCWALCDCLSSGQSLADDARNRGWWAEATQTAALGIEVLSK